MEELDCTGNELTSLDLSQNVALRRLKCYFNELSSINLTQNTALERLECFTNNLTTIDLTQNTALTYLRAELNSLGTLDLSQNVMLDYINLSRTQLTAIDLTANVALENIVLTNNLLTSINVSQNVNVRGLFVDDNSLTSINVVTNQALQQFYCDNNAIEYLDLSNNTQLLSLKASNNALTRIDLKNGNNTILPSAIGGFFDVTGNPNLTCIEVDDVAYSTTNWTDVDAGVNFNTNCPVPIPANDECANTINIPISDGTCSTTTSGTLEGATNSNGFNCFGSTEFSDVWYSFVATETTHDIKILNTSGANSRVFHAVIDAQTYNCGNITDAVYCTDSLEDQATGLTIGNTYFLQIYTDVANSTETFDVCVASSVIPGLTYVPDNNFEQALIDLSLDDVLDDYVVTSNINTVNDLNIRDLGIFDLTGIEDFAALEILNCGLNFLGELDLSQNTNLNYLIADNTALIGLNVKNGNNTNVTTFITLGNVDLFCIEVDDAAYSTANWTLIESGTSFSEYCGTPIQVAAKVYLQGAMLQNTDGFMRTDLQDNNHVPMSTPYTDGINASGTVLQATGQDKIVDWVWVELRGATNPTIIIDGKSALLQRDGDIVDATASDIVTPVNFNQTPGDYYVVIKHRNHLGIMSNNALSLSDVVTTVDFTNSNNQMTYGVNAQTTFGMPDNTLGMWCGNVNGDTVVQYAGTTPDTPTLLSTILNDAGNFLNFPTYVLNGYNANDINMDGTAQYAGTTPDTPFILQNALAHPGNFLNFSTYQIIEQLPENE